jgi:hypothetical protein
MDILEIRIVPFNSISASHNYNARPPEKIPAPGRLPRKSTCFYPKLPSGLAVKRLA